MSSGGFDMLPVPGFCEREKKEETRGEMSEKSMRKERGNKERTSLGVLSQNIERVGVCQTDTVITFRALTTKDIETEAAIKSFGRVG
jgi:hypothetical protein